MGRVDSAQHTFRVNLNNPKHLLVHQTLMELNLDIHKSRANFIIECLYSVIKGTEDYEDAAIDEGVYTVLGSF